MTALNVDRIAQIKRSNGDDAVLRMLLLAKTKGASPQDVVAVAKDVGLGATNLARLKAQVGWTPERRKAPREGATDRRSRVRALDRSREKKALRAMLGDDERVSSSVFPLSDDQADVALKLFSAYGGQKLEHDNDTHAMFLVRDTDADDRLWLASIDRAKGDAVRVGQPMIPSELASHVDEETFAELFPKAPAIDAIEADEVLPLLAQGSKAFEI